MDLSYVNEVFHFYEPDVGLHWLQGALEQMNTTDALIDLTIGTVTCGLLVGLYRYRRLRQAKSQPSTCAETVQSHDLQARRNVNRLRSLELFSENALPDSLADDSGLLTDDASSSTSSFAQSDDNADPLLLNISTPEKDVSDSKENGDATSVTGDVAAKVIYKKMLQDGVNARLQLVRAEKKILAQMKTMQSLKRSLLESSVANSSQDSSINKTSIAISRRKSFFDVDRTDKTFLKRSSAVGTNSDAKEDATKVKLMNLKENISQLIDVHMNELSSLHESISEKRVQTKKLETMKKEIDSMYEKTVNENNKEKQLTVDKVPRDKIINFLDTTTENNMAEQEEVKKSSQDNNLMNQLQSITSLKNLFKNYDNQEELSTIMEQSNEDAENSLILLNDISTLQRDLKSIKKSWSTRSSTPHKSPGARPVST